MSNVLKPCSEKQARMLSHNAEVLFIGGACGGGKSHILTMLPLRYIDCKKFRGSMLRRTTPQLMKSGNLWDKAKSIYGQLDKKYRPKFLKGDKKVAIFPHGPEIEYSHMQHESDKENFQGAEMTFFGIDEALQFEWSQINYLFSRMRSDSKYQSRLIMSGNPSPDHEIADMIEWYLDDEGYVHPEKEGVTRYFIVVNDDLIWANNPDTLINEYKTKYWTPKPKSFSFLSSTVYDNKVCLEQNPGYVSFLEGLPHVEKARLLWGNWKVRPEGANYFKRENLNKADGIPFNAIACRGWDKAGQVPTDVEKFPDYTACIKMYKTRENEFYISGEPHPDCHDDFDKELYLKFRAKPGRRDAIILKQALFDGDDCTQILPQDPGAAGSTEFIESAKKLLSQGVLVKKDPAVSNKSKLQKFSPFAAAVEAGIVYIVENTFPNKHTLEAFYKELEAFDGSPSTRKKKDDFIDVVATSYNYLSQEKNIPIVCRNQINNPTKAKRILDRR